MAYIPQKLSVRYFCLTRKDQSDYWELLTAAFPEIRCYVEPHHSLLTGERPPELGVYRHPPPQAPRIFLDFVDFVFDADWRPIWERWGRGQWWSIENFSLPNGEFDRGGNIVIRSRPNSKEPPSDPDRVVSGRITFRSKKDDREQEAIARKGIRLIAKVASNRIAAVEYPSLRILRRHEKGGWLWIGHDAARICRENPYCFAYYNGYLKQGYRPLE